MLRFENLCISVPVPLDAWCSIGRPPYWLPVALRHGEKKSKKILQDGRKGEKERIPGSGASNELHFTDLANVDGAKLDFLPIVLSCY